MRKPLILAVLLVAASCTPAYAAEEAQCRPTAEMLAGLKAAGSYPIGAGIDDSGLLVQVFVNPVRAVWAIFTTAAEGTMCFRGGGQNWFTQDLPGDGA